MPLSRDHEGRLFPGHKSFEWLKCVIDAVISAQKRLKPGEYLWELIHPKDKDGAPLKSANGKYRVKLFIMVGRGSGSSVLVCCALRGRCSIWPITSIIRRDVLTW